MHRSTWKSSSTLIVGPHKSHRKAKVNLEGEAGKDGEKDLHSVFEAGARSLQGRGMNNHKLSHVTSPKGFGV